MLGYKKAWTEAFLPQSLWLLDDNGHLIVNKQNIGRFEHLQVDVQKLFNFDLDIHVNISHKRNKDWTFYYTNKEVRDKVEKLYHDDFEILGYEFYRPK